MPRLSITNKELGLEVVRLRKTSRGTANMLKKRVREAAGPLKKAVEVSALEAGMHKAAAAVSIRQRYSKKSASIRVEVNAKKAPNARPLDRGNQAAHTMNRHPVFADPGLTRYEWHWVNQPVRPFFDRGTERGSHAATKNIEKVLNDMADALQ